MQRRSLVRVYSRYLTEALCEANELIDKEVIETMKAYCRPPEKDE